ncbi:MAG: hypothetical protein U0931_11245 [Vulcanimicrobiota bacterium]
MKNHNIPILLVLIAVVAVAAQFLRHSPSTPDTAPWERDLEACLGKLWQRDGQQVRLEAGPDGNYRLRAQVNQPRATRLRQQRWNYPFLRFACTRFSQIRLGEVQVEDKNSRNLIPETAMNGLLADRIAPRAEGGDEERACVLTGRQLSAQLDQRLGAGQTLVLVDALSTSSQNQPAGYGKRAITRGPVPGAFDLVVWVVSRRALSPLEWGELQSAPLANVRNPRLVVLP